MRQRVIHKISRKLVPLLLTSAMILTVSVSVLPAAPATAAAESTDCGHVFILGARGSGQAQAGVTDRASKKYDGGTGLGPQVYSASNSLFAKIVEPRIVVRHSLHFPARPVPKGPHPSAVRKYFDGLTEGVDNVKSTLRERSDSCPHERIVLLGYSQGAMVVHRVLRWLGESAQASMAARFAGAMLIADGDRVTHDNYTRYGSAGELYDGVGLAFPPVSGSSMRRLPAAFKTRVHSVCNARDLVCDFSGVFNFTGVGIHSAYTNSPPVNRAAGAIAASVLKWPVMAPSAQIATGTVGSPLTYRLTADTGNVVTRLRWRVPASSALPAGLRLSATGVVSGTPTATGARIVSVEVRRAGTGRYSGWVGGGQLIIAITAASPPTQPPAEPEPESALTGLQTTVG